MLQICTKRLTIKQQALSAQYSILNHYETSHSQSDFSVLIIQYKKFNLTASTSYTKHINYIYNRNRR